MKTFIINNKSHFRHLWLLIFLLVFVPIALYYLMIFRNGGYTSEKALIGGITVFIVFFLPMAILHVNHYLYSKGDRFSYDESQGIMIYERKENEVKFGVKDIDSITCHKSWPLAENRTPIFPWDIYNYATIQLNNGSVFKLSSLLVYEFDKKVDFNEIKIKKTFYPWIS